MHPSFEQFVAALRDPAQRPGIGLSISDADATTLLTRADWAQDYYSRWIALFPAAAVAPTPAPAATVDAPPAWAATPKRRMPSAARIAVIVVLTIAALWAVAGVINVVRTLTYVSTSAPANRPAAVTLPPSSANSDPVVFHGLTKTEYDLLEAVLAPQGHTLEEAVENGADDAELRQTAANAETSIAKTCTDGKALNGGFDNPTFRASFITTYEAEQKATPEQATNVFVALSSYCEVQ